MNTKAILFFVCILSFVHFAHADDLPGQPSELTDLKTKYQSDVRDATKELREKYREDLKQLMHTEMIKGDADAIIAVKLELMKMEPDFPCRGKWVSSDGIDVMQFFTNGKWSETFKGDPRSGTWKANGDSDFTVSDPGNPGGSHFEVLHYHLTNTAQLQLAEANTVYSFQPADD